MGAKASVSKITVSVGKHTFDLTLDEARALKDELNKVLEPKVVMPPIRDRVERIIEREVPRWPNYIARDVPQLGEIRCESRRERALLQATCQLPQRG